MIKYIEEVLFRLMQIDSPTGYTKGAAQFVKAELESFGYCPCLTKKGGILCDLKGEGTPVVIAGHLDTLGAIVSQIKGSGRLKLSKLGGLAPINCETENLVVKTREGKSFEGTFQLVNASVHVNDKFSSTERNFDTMEVVLDYNVNTNKDVEKLGISVGDFVCFETRTRKTSEGYLKSRYLDDKLSVAIMLGVAKGISLGEIKLDKKAYMFMSTYEEVGHGSSSGIPCVEEILCVDMGCVGEGLSATERDVSICVKDSSGPYDYELTTRLINLAKEKGLSYKADVYPFYSSDASAALLGGLDAKHALIGPGIYASHGYERSHLDGVKNTFELIKLYISK